MPEKITQFNTLPSTDIPIEIQDKIDNINRSIEPGALMDMQIDLELDKSQNPHKEVLLTAIQKRLQNIKETQNTSDLALARIERKKISRDERAEIGITAVSPKEEHRYVSVEKILGDATEQANLQDIEKIKENKEYAEKELLKITLLKEFQLSQDLITRLKEDILPKLDTATRERTSVAIQTIENQINSLYMRFQENTEPDRVEGTRSNYFKSMETEVKKHSALLGGLYTATIQIINAK